MNYVAANAGANDVVNMSLGGGADRVSDQAILALSQVCKVAVAAGNDAFDANFQSPGRVNSANIYTVSAIDIFDKLASFSSYGNGPVDFAAPGVNVASCWLNGGYAYNSGTSMATPHVAGLLLLGNICSNSKATGDPDGNPDPIAVHLDGGAIVDSDHDGFTVCAGDLNDADATIYPGATEVCGDGKDNNQDGNVDEGCCPAGNPTLIYVKANAAGANNGLSWDDAFTSMQSALTAAKKCAQITQIWVAGGTYYPSEDQFGQSAPTDPRTKTFSMRNNVAIYGGFVGNEPGNYDLSLRDMGANATILSGDIQQNTTDTDNAYHVLLNFPRYPKTFVYGSNLPSMDGTAVLDGFYVINGSATLLIATSTGNQLSFPHSIGGGMMNYAASPAIRNCNFQFNGGYLGGGIANVESNPTISNSWFGALSGQYGGGMYNDISSPVITNSEFQMSAAQYGAGIYNEIGSSPVVTNSSFSGNNATISGGGMYNTDGSSPVIKNSIFWGNSTEIAVRAPATGIAASVPNVSYSIVKGGGWSGTGNLNVDPQFINQPTVGGNTFGDLSIRDCSLAANAGDPSTTTGTVGTLDLKKQNRIFGGRVDMGAYELQTAPVPFAPLITANPGFGIIPGESTTLTASGAVSYVWSTTATTAAITVSPAATTTYTVTATAGQCSQAVNGIVTVGPPTWTGTASTDWNTPGNWASGAVPRATHNVTIPAEPTNKPIIGTAAVAQSVVVNSGSSLNITPAGSLTINNAPSHGLYNNGGTVSNSGSLLIGNTANIGAHAILNNGTFTNTATGIITTDRFHDSGIRQLLLTPSYTNLFTNNGQISIGTADGNNFGIENEGAFVNNAGSITVGFANNSAIHNVGPFTNNAVISIKGTLSGGPGRGIFNQNNFTNNPGGVINLDRSIVGILNDSPFTNYGAINIGQTLTVTTGVTSTGTFNNSGCVAVINTNPLINGGGTFTNSGNIIENASGTSNIGSNSGVVHNLNGGAFNIGSTTAPGVLTTSASTVVVPNTLTVSVTPASQDVAPGQQVTLTASGATSYTWSNSTTANPLIVTAPAGTTIYTVTGVSGICSGEGSGSVKASALPVTLVSFAAQKQSNGSVKLVWVTANEVDNSYFELERATDPRQPEFLAKVLAQDVASPTHNYSFSDELPYRGTSYYRLKQVDLDGHKTTYAWVSIVSNQTYMVYPNPIANHRFNLQLDEPEKAILKFYSVDGKVMPLQTTSRGTGSLDLKLPKTATPGSYILEVKERGQTRSYRLVVVE